ncbi:hypothetical protein [Acinetobacter nosocomialis]|uniref:hypothetical protein n=1 Tax=Acinetobacter nosocomialis TaxID=106654 RepID=UPI001F464936|nr:hypothetical protein [Acinetobacter nosocomialis]MCE7534207.1 hypothetical protein [Acinetobacter nosocomialis]
MLNLIFFCVWVVLAFKAARYFLNSKLLDKLNDIDMKKTAELHDAVKSRICDYARPTEVGIFINHESFDVKECGKKKAKEFIQVSNSINDFYYIAGNKNFVTVDIRDEENIKILGTLLVLKPKKKSKEYSIYLTEI